MKTFKELLINLHACPSARIWAGDMSIEEVVEKCHRGDWLLWLAQKVNVELQKLTLAKGYCAQTVLHLMKDERSIKAVEAAIKFGNGSINKQQLQNAAYAAAYADADADADAAAYAAAYADADAAADVAVAAYAAYAAAAAAYAAAKMKNQLLTAYICRKYIGEDIIQLVNNLLK